MHLIKDPDATLDYAWDWSAWLPEGDQIASAVVTATGVTVDQQAHTPTTVTAWLSGGEPGRTASATCRVTTSQGRTDDRTITLSLSHR